MSIFTLTYTNKQLLVPSSLGLYSNHKLKQDAQYWGILMMSRQVKIIYRGAAIFEAASGCILYRDPMSNKVELLLLGRWKGSLQQEDLPVRYIALSKHLDILGVQLKSTYTQTREVNGNILQEKVNKTTGSWQGGQYMSLSL